MQLIAIPYLLIFDMASPIVWMAGTMQALMDIILGIIYEANYRNVWIIVILAYLAVELTINLFAEIERSNLDGDKLKIIEVLGIILLQVPKIMVYMFVIMPARFYGTITYVWRKNVG